jgi:hypothetical protein
MNLSLLGLHRRTRVGIGGQKWRSIKLPRYGRSVRFSPPHRCIVARPLLPQAAVLPGNPYRQQLRLRALLPMAQPLPFNGGGGGGRLTGGGGGGRLTGGGGGGGRRAGGRVRDFLLTHLHFPGVYFLR